MVVAAQYEEGLSEENPFHDQNSLRKKLENLTAHKKNTSDPSCSQKVTCANHAARHIVGKANAREVEESSLDDDAGEAVTNEYIT